VSLSTGLAQLNSAVKALRQRWDRVKDDWHDRVSSDFETQHLEPLEAQVTTVLRRMDQLSHVLVEVEQQTS
jgi:hypothetical protein